MSESFRPINPRVPSQLNDGELNYLARRASQSEQERRWASVERELHLTFAMWAADALSLLAAQTRCQGLTHLDYHALSYYPLGWTCWFCGLSCSPGNGALDRNQCEHCGAPRKANTKKISHMFDWMRGKP